MAFDKKAYSDRRKQGLRGQGELGNIQVTDEVPMNVDRMGTMTREVPKKPGKYAIRKNTKRARKAQVNGL